MRKIIAAAAIALSLSGCAGLQSPKADQIAAADFGAPIDQQLAELDARRTLNVALKDPDSARWVCGAVEKAWIHDSLTKTEDTFYGYRLKCLVNAKNSYGGYVGDRKYQFYFHDGELKRIYNFQFEDQPDSIVRIY